ncbi:response regulator [uncultured Kiloniella sp.]|uniref:response regulator n=1 Tax=uncultured Kiloniella sp. TaxID=1133091 RepID=UPI00261C7A71|nr:response regulator [uncultured Kiloniella sp.]
MEKAKHLLIVDDDEEIRDLLTGFLTQRGFRVSEAGSGDEMRRELNKWSIDLIILDIMLPGEDGLSLCRAVREKSDVPIIMLTAVTGDADRIVGLEVGADDYLEKPFNPRELLARMKAIFRRVSGVGADDNTYIDQGIANRVFKFSGWQLHEGKREIRSPDKFVVHLSSGEFALLVAFLEHPQKVLTRDDLINATRGVEAIAFDRSIDIQVSRLRKKLENDADRPKLIKTVRGQGYIFAEKVSVNPVLPVRNRA